MKIEPQEDGSYLATGKTDGIPYVAEGSSMIEAMRSALLIVAERHLRTCLEGGPGFRRTATEPRGILGVIDPEVGS